MNDVFPEIWSVPLAEAAGSVAVIPHPDGPLLTLVTNESIQNGLRSIVILNLKSPNNLPVQFHENWRDSEMCLCYKTPLRFELSNKESDIDTSGNWYRRVGVIASINNQLCIRAVAAARGGFRYVNVQTGSVFSGDLPNYFVTFGVWSIWLRDPLRERSSLLFDFNVHQLP